MEHDYRVDNFGETMLYRKSATSTIDWYLKDPGRDAWFAQLSPNTKMGLLERVISHGAMDMLLHWKKTQAEWIHQPELRIQIQQRLVDRKNIRPMAILGLIQIGLKDGIEDLLILMGDHFRYHSQKQRRKQLNTPTQHKLDEHNKYKKHQDVIALAKIHQLYPDVINVYSLYRSCLSHPRAMFSPKRCPPSILEYLPYHPEGHAVYGLLHQQYSSVNANNLLDGIEGLPERMHQKMLSITQQPADVLTVFPKALLAWINGGRSLLPLPENSYAEEYLRLKELLSSTETVDSLLTKIHDMRKASTLQEIALDDAWDLV